MTVGNVIERGSQAAVVVILKRDEAERLQHAVVCFAHGAENLRHAVDRARLGLKGNFDKFTLRERTRDLQQAASDRYGLQFCFCVPAIF